MNNLKDESFGCKALEQPAYGRRGPHYQPAPAPCPFQSQAPLMTKRQDSTNKCLNVIDWSLQGKYLSPLKSDKNRKEDEFRPNGRFIVWSFNRLLSCCEYWLASGQRQPLAYCLILPDSTVVMRIVNVAYANCRVPHYDCWEISHTCFHGIGALLAYTRAIRAGHCVAWGCL